MEKSFDESVKRLEEIVRMLETGQAISIDQYTQLAEEAKLLIENCRSRLTTLDSQIQSIFTDN